MILEMNSFLFFFPLFFFLMKLLTNLSKNDCYALMNGLCKKNFILFRLFEVEREKIEIDRREEKTKITTVVFLSTMKKAINTRWSRHGRRGNEANIDFYRPCCEIFQN